MFKNERVLKLQPVLLLIFIILIISFPLSAQQTGNVSVTKWADGKKSAFSFTFDDGFQTQYDYAKPILEEFNFKGTFYLISSGLTDSIGNIWRYGTWKEFREMAAEGHEIASHTVTHPHLPTLEIGDEFTPNTLVYELSESKKVIEDKIPGYKCISLAYPYTEHNATVDAIVKNYYENGRDGSDLVSNSSFTGNEWYSIHSRVNNFNLPRNSTDDDLDELDAFKNYVQTAIDEGKWAVLMAHEIYPFSELQKALNFGSYYPLTTEWFTDLCSWIKGKNEQDDIWVSTVGNITRYIKERDNFQYEIIASDESQIEINAHDDLDNAIYNFPLTVDIIVPTDWQNVSVSQGEKTEIVAAHFDGVNNIVTTKLIPDGGNLKLQNGIIASACSIKGKITYHNNPQKPVQNVEITLTSDNVQKSAVTDAFGSYSFTNLRPGEYNISLKKEDDWGGSNSTDALIILKSFTEEEKLDSLQLKAADVNNNGTVNATDALLVLRRFSKKISSFKQDDWVFYPQNSQIDLNSSDAVFNSEGLAAGDVNNSYSP